MTGRRGSTRGPLMKFVCLPAHSAYSTSTADSTKTFCQRFLDDHDRRSPRLRPQFGRDRKPTPPHDLVALVVAAVVDACDHRPEPALRLGQVTILQQFFDLLGGLGMGRPESISGTPVPHP